MSESVKPRFGVDLSEIERQLAQTPSAQPQPNPGVRNDPLAELARIVGQDDPFQAILSNDRAARPRPQSAAIDDLFAASGPVAPASRDVHDHHRGMRRQEPQFGLDPFPAETARPAEPAYPYETGQPPQQGQVGYDNHAYDDQSYYQEAAPQQARTFDEPDAHGSRLAAGSSRFRKRAVAVGLIGAAVAIGVGGSYLVLARPGAGTSGAPPLVKAQNEPVKVQPQNPGGVEIPNQNKQIYERSAQPGTETRVVNREEQPVDVRQAVRMNGGDPAAQAGAPPAAQPSNGLNLGEPRRVRTVSVRPDGTIVRPETAPPPPGAPSAPSAPRSPIPTMTLPTAAQAQPPAQPANTGPVQVASAQAQPTPVSGRPAASTPPAPAAATPAPATPATAAARPATPAPAPATPASGPSPQQRVAAVPPAAAAAPAAPAPVAGDGSFSVQLGVANSEGEANASLARLQRRFPELEGLPSLIRRAEVNGNSVYRVRVGPLSREEASSLCSRLQGQGGQCFVARN